METEEKEVAAAIIKNSKCQVLIVRRLQEEKGVGSATLSWTFPGGEVEEKEAPEDAVKRNVLDQLNVVVEILHLITERKHPEFPAYIYYYECKLESAETSLKLNTAEISDFKWVKPEEIKNYLTSDFDPTVKEYVLSS